MDRITQKILDGQLLLLAKKLNKKVGYEKGCLSFDTYNGYVCIVEMEESGGHKAFGGHGKMTKREMYHAIDLLLNLIFSGEVKAND